MPLDPAMAKKAKTLTAPVAPILPRFLGLEDAVRYSALSKRRLKELALAGEIRYRRDIHDQRGKGDDGRWVFYRDSIDDWWDRQPGGDSMFEDIDRISLEVLS